MLRQASNASRARQRAREKVSAEQFGKAVVLVQQDFQEFLVFANELKNKLGSPISHFDSVDMTKVLFAFASAPCVSTVPIIRCGFHARAFLLESRAPGDVVVSQGGAAGRGERHRGQ